MQAAVVALPSEVDRIDSGVVAYPPVVLPVPIGVAAHMLQPVVPRHARIESVHNRV